MKIRIITSEARVRPDVAYPIDWAGRIHRPGQFVIELDVRDESAVRFTEGRTQDDDTVTILQPGMVDVLSAVMVAS